MRAAFLGVLACLALGLTSCVTMGRLAAGELLGAGAAGNSALGEQVSRCEKLAKLPINLEEERAFGGAMAVELAHRGGGLFIDVKEDFEALQAQMHQGDKKPHPTLAATPANDLTRYLNVVGKGLANRSARPTLPWKFGVLNSESINAFSAPYGYVFVTRGLLRKIDNEAQLAGVLAHEIAHVTEQHALDTYRTTKTLQCGAAIMGQQGGNILGAVVPAGPTLPLEVVQAYQQLAGSNTGFLDLDAGENLKLLEDLVPRVVDFVVKHGLDPDKEYAADRVGLELVVSAGYNPNAYIEFLSRLQDSKEILSTHPPLESRTQRLTAWLEDAAKSPLYEGGPAFSTYPVVPLKNELAAAR